MSEANAPKLSLKIVVNKQKSKVLFAEANSHVADVLLSFLTLPLGKMVRILEKHYGSEAPVIGSITTLYRGLSDLDSRHFYVGGAKQMLLNPRSSLEAECRRLIVDITDSQPTKYFVCEDSDCTHSEASNISLFPDIARCDCGKPLSTELVVGGRLAAGEADHEVFTSKMSSFIISDDLRVMANKAGFVQALKNLGITDSTDGAELRSLSLGVKNIMDLLKFALISTTPLTNVFINSGKISTTSATEYGPGVFKSHIQNEANNTILKVTLQKSTNKFLFGRAKDDFLELLFSFLTIPLGGVEEILGGETCLKNIDNLYTSMSNGIYRNYFKTPGTKNRLINPKLAHGYINYFKSPDTKNRLIKRKQPNSEGYLDLSQFLPLTEESPPKLYCRDQGIFSHEKPGSLVSSFKSSLGVGGYAVKEPMVYIVSDDLTVAPYSIASSILILKRLRVPLSDVREMEWHIGQEEALSILKASLTSKTAITDALINPMLNTKYPLQHQPKQYIWS
ncbi:hypothetical protein C2S53_002118 [Perilla frutescens var. hirtella]|uniref:DUF674 family protein n=1 Tax=Perilla frutescens var. hirtella TaxID=608512 RepID=A0AAD4IP93_PERFH|nr:hypothetical protein C2S53_002118 [Perilla frutescens var. hirtella]